MLIGSIVQSAVTKKGLWSQPTSTGPAVLAKGVLEVSSGVDCREATMILTLIILK